MTTQEAGIGYGEPINGDPTGKDILSMHQFSGSDIGLYIEEATAALEQIRSGDGSSLLSGRVLSIFMDQPSTRTSGSMFAAMARLGGSPTIINGTENLSAAKGETPLDTSVALATQSDVIATRTKGAGGPAEAAAAIREYESMGKLSRLVPVINLGDGTNEHPTQALGDLLTIHQELGELEGVRIAMVGDHERYRAFHSLFIGAAAVGARITAIQSEAAPVPPELVEHMGSSLEIVGACDLDGVMQQADVLYLGRNPGEYSGTDAAELARSQRLAADYGSWRVDRARLQQMSSDAIVMHPRPRGNELSVDADADPRTRDVAQMEYMIPMRMAIIAGALGRSIRDA